MTPRILVYATGPLGECLAGPEIRAIQTARALSADYEVTVMAQRRDACVRGGLRVVPSGRTALVREAARQDAIVSPCLPPYLLALKRLLGVVAIADLYDPHARELVTLDNERHERELRLRSMSLAVGLAGADLVLCASARQREDLVAAARTLRRPSRSPAVDPVVVPFGIPGRTPASHRRPLRAHFPQITANDKVVLWWGTIWRWLDAETAIRAFARIASKRDDVKLVITAGRPPNKNNRRFEATEEARALARDLRLLDRTVLFLDDWIPYDDRHDYLGEADIGLTLHRSSEEASLAARSRYMDYLAAQLPCVLGRGDETAAEFEAAGFATLLDRPDPKLLAETLLALVDDPGTLAAARAAGARLAAERGWSAVGHTLRVAVASALTDRQPEGPASAALLRGTCAYYGRKLADFLSAPVG